MHKLSDNMLVGLALPTTALIDSNGGAEATSAYFDMREFDKAAFVADLVDNIAHATVTIVLLAASDAIGTNAEVVKTGSVGLMAADVVAVMETKAEDLPEGKPFVALKVTDVGGAVNPTVMAALFSPHHAFENKIGADFLFNSWE